MKGLTLLKTFIICLFFASCDKEDSTIIYPESGSYGLNILDKEKTVYKTGTYSMHAILPKGSTLKVKIKGDFHWSFDAVSNNTGWEYSSWNSDNSRTFTSKKTGEIDFKIMLESFANEPNKTYTNKIDIIVFENEAIDATWTKEINIY